MWEPEQIYKRSVADSAGGTNDVTYHNLIFLSAEGSGQGRVYNFIRNEISGSWDCWFIYSDDLGFTWNWGGRHTGQNNSSIRPYPKYASNGVDTIWWISSEDNSGQSVWSGYIKDGKNHNMAGAVVDADVCFFSANVDPATGAALVSGADGRRNFEIFRAETSDAGATWAYTQITRDSSCHNFRLSVVPWDENNTAVMWMRGYYDRWYFNANNNGWDCTLVAWLDRSDEASEPLLSYTDADLSNTTLADGSALTTHTTGTGSGADDNEWHFRTDPSFGNNGTHFTANESAPYAENCPLLKTTIPGVSPGTYDVFVCFWSPHGNDYDVMAGLSASSLAFFERPDSQHAPTSQFDTAVRDTDASRHLYRGYVGRVTLGQHRLGRGLHRSVRQCRRLEPPHLV